MAADKGSRRTARNSLQKPRGEHRVRSRSDGELCDARICNGCHGHRARYRARPHDGESHRRIAIIEVMGRQSGYIALGTAYGEPDIILVPESPLNLDVLVERVMYLYDLQKNVVI